MGNTHGTPDTLKEWQAIGGDLLPACLLTSAGVTAPGSGLTITAASCTAYARSGVDLVYIDQPAVSVTVPNVAGSHWLIAHRDTHSTVAGWTRRAGSHFLTQQAATQPTIPDGAVLVAQLTVAGGNITAVSTSVALTPPLSRQTADAVTITDGTATLSTLTTTQSVTAQRGIEVPQNPANDTIAFYGRMNAGGTNRYNVLCAGTAPNALLGPLWVSTALPPTGDPPGRVIIAQARGTLWGLILQTSGDGGGTGAIQFRNASNTEVGYITTNATTTTYATSSDGRLKEAVETLTNALGIVRALRPVTFRWKADGSVGHGLVAQEVQPLVPEAVAEGEVLGIDYSKLVPFLIGAAQTLAARLEAAEARLNILTDALGR